MNLIDDEDPLKQNYIPEKLVDREEASSILESRLGGTQNLHLNGPRGTGKTVILRKKLRKLDVRTCYIPCTEYDTQYQALRKILGQLTRETVSTGHHTSQLQRQLKEQLEVLNVVIALDEIDFLLSNDGEDLLYFLSRIPDPPQVITVSADNRELRDTIEPRTYSSLQPYPIQFEPYTGKQICEILADRAQKALKSETLHRNALTYIASKTQDVGLSLTWLRTAAKTLDTPITETEIKDIQQDAYQRHIETRLKKQTQHHRHLYQAIQELSKEVGPVVKTGKIYQRYQKITGEHGIKTLSNRRISDHLKQLELLDLIEAEYHYGGSKGKTREIQLNKAIKENN